MLRDAIKHPVSIVLFGALLLLLNTPLTSSALLGGRLEMQILPPSGEAQLSGLIQVTIENLASGERQQHWIRSSEPVSFDLSAGVYQISLEAEGRQTVQRRIRLSDFADWGTVMLSLTLGALDRSPPLPPQGGSTVSIDVLRIPRKALRELEKAGKLEQHGKLQKAIRHLEKALEIDPGFFQAHNNLGAIYLRLSRPAEARQSLERALEIRPDDPMALRNLSYLQLSAGQFDQAVKTLSRLIRSRPSDCWAYEYQGEALYQLGRIALAETSFFQALALDPSSSMAHYRLGEIAYKRKDFEAALTHFRAYLQSDSATGSRHVEQLVKDLEAAQSAAPPRG